MTRSSVTWGHCWISKNKKHDDIDNKYLFEINNRWTIDGSTRKNIARYINHACKPNAESDVNARKRKVIIRAIKTIEPGEEINYDYGTDYFKIFLKPIGCKCDSCEKKRKKKRAEERAEKLRLKLKAEKEGSEARGKGQDCKGQKGQSIRSEGAEVEGYQSRRDCRQGACTRHRQADQDQGFANQSADQSPSIKELGARKPQQRLMLLRLRLTVDLKQHRVRDQHHERDFRSGGSVSRSRGRRWSCAGR